MAAFPTTVATDADLYIAVNAVSTQLTDNPLTIGATTVNVIATAAFPTVGFISIDNEIISYTGKTATSFTGCTRGADGTAASSHVQNSQVFHNVIAAHHNALKDDLIAVESYLSTHIGLTTAVTAAEFERLSGVTSSIQTQLNAKATDSLVVHLSGTETITGSKSFSAGITSSAQTSNTFLAQSSFAGGTLGMAIDNQSNTASSETRMFLRVGGSSAGDAFTAYSVSGVTNWAEGIDNSDGDRFKISASSALGTNDFFIIDPSTGFIACGANATMGPAFSLTDNSTSDLRYLLFKNNATGDPFINWSTNATNWSMGIDNSDSDVLNITEANSIGGVNTRLRMPTGGQLQMSDGGASAPEYSFINETAMGMYRAGSGILAFAVSGTKRLDINGTALEFFGTSHAYIYCDRTANTNESLVIFSTAGTGNCAIGLDNDGTNNLYFFTNGDLGTPKMKIFSSGGVNIGAPTGGDKGSGTLNLAADVYKNNTAYTNPDYVLEHWATGKIERFKSNPGASQYPGMLPIAEIENYMRTNHDLPGVKERFRDEDGGQGIFARADIVLEKLEEAYIYIAELHKRISALEAAHA